MPCAQTGKEVTWWSITSTTANISVLESASFLGKKGARTIFDIQARCALILSRNDMCVRQFLAGVPTSLTSVTSTYEA